METKSKVYILLDSSNRIIRCEGGYSISNITDISEWTLIDEGNGDRFNLCQSHYFESGLYTDTGIPRYKFVDGTPVLRTAEEIDADKLSEPEPTETIEHKIEQLTNAVLATGANV